MIAFPLSLVAELTHRCPLRCVYCSNPIELQKKENELNTDQWISVLEQASTMGVLQCHFTGGEPLLREDLEVLIRHARQNKLYTNLITSGVGLNEKKLGQLVDAGLDHVQLSFQDSVEARANEICGTRAHATKVEAAKWIRKSSIAFTINIVLHRKNADQLSTFIDFAVEQGAQRIEIAHTQYYGWAFLNRRWLVPTYEQVQNSISIVDEAKKRLLGKVRIDFVTPDYYAQLPKPCRGGWGKTTMVISPSGDMLPCHSAQVLPHLKFDNVARKTLTEIWENSGAFQMYRGTEWMKGACSNCERKTIDFGGCRCQSFLLTGDAFATDPVCSLSSQRNLIDNEIAAILQNSKDDSQAKWNYRNFKI